jgi:hypothetical protein
MSIKSVIAKLERIAGIKKEPRRKKKKKARRKNGKRRF